MDLDDLIPEKTPQDYEIGSNLETMSVEELKALVDKLKAEIARVEEEMRSKEAVRNAANSVFKDS